MGNIAVFGGTFNPIHNEHVRLIKHLSSLDFIHSILVIPTHIPPHKSVGYLAEDNDRLNMCRLATKGIEKVFVSDLEIKRQSRSYTFYTVQALKEQFPNDRLFVVCGGDMAITLHTWHRFEELKKMCTFLIVDRPGTDKKELRDYVDILIRDGARIEYTLCITEDVSSSDIRKNIFASNSIPENVAAYIKEKGIYETK